MTVSWSLSHANLRIWYQVTSIGTGSSNHFSRRQGVQLSMDSKMLIFMQMFAIMMYWLLHGQPFWRGIIIFAFLSGTAR